MRASVDPGICVCLYEHVFVCAFVRVYVHPTFPGTRELFQELVTVRYKTAAEPNRPEFKKERELTSRFAEVTQKILRGNSCVTSLTFRRVNAGYLMLSGHLTFEPGAEMVVVQVEHVQLFFRKLNDLYKGPVPVVLGTS